MLNNIMKIKLLITSTLMALPMFLLASTPDPIADFKQGLTIPPSDKILKWTADISGNGKKAVFLSLKSDFDEAKNDNDIPGWVLYIPESAGTSYQEFKGIKMEPNTISLILPNIDIDLCYIGQITQLGKKGIVTIQTHSARSGPDKSTSYIYAYVIEEDHLKRTKLAEYDSTKSVETNPIYQQYLTDAKRTKVKIKKITP